MILLDDLNEVATDLFRISEWVGLLTLVLLPFIDYCSVNMHCDLLILEISQSALLSLRSIDRLQSHGDG